MPSKRAEWSDCSVWEQVFHEAGCLSGLPGRGSEPEGPRRKRSRRVFTSTYLQFQVAGGTEPPLLETLLEHVHSLE